jgi:NDP-sugar pyrophosphorylase family protein
MDNFNFFDLFEIKNFLHKSLFEKSKYFFDIFDNLKNYLKSYSFETFHEMDGVFFENPSQISIGKNTKIEKGAFIKGPCIIGDDCEIRHSAYIRGNVITGNNCIIGHSTEVKNSIFLNNAKAAHFAYVGESILGNRVNIGAGVKLANFRLDKKNIKINIDSKIINTNRNKVGAIIGDDSQIGCNSVLNPGTIIGKNSIIYPSLNVFGYIKDNTIVKTKNNLLIKPYKLRNI